MITRHFVRAGALFTVALVGCSKQTKDVPEEPPATERFSQLAQNAPSAQPSGHTDLNLSTGDTTDVPALKTTSYAAELERLLAERATDGAAARAAAAAGANPATQPAAAKSEVTWVDNPKQLPAPTPAQSLTQTAAVAKVEQTGQTQPTIHQLLDTAPAAANRATAIPADGSAGAVKPAPVMVAKAESPAQPKQAGADLLTSDTHARKLSERIQQDPLDVAAQLDYQLLKLISDHSVPDLTAIAPLPSEDREIVSAVVDGLSNFRTRVRTDGNVLLTQKVGPLIEMGDRLRTQSTLAIPSLVLCRDVVQYGVYQPFPSTRFPFGEKHLVVVYCEVANFASQLNSKGLWETKLKYEVLLYTDSSDASMQVWQQKPTPVIDQCHSRRRDFFIAKLLELPQDLPVNSYLMKVSIIDETANRIAEATVPLQIVAK